LRRGDDKNISGPEEEFTCRHEHEDAGILEYEVEDYATFNPGFPSNAFVCSFT